MRKSRALILLVPAIWWAFSADGSAQIPRQLSHPEHNEIPDRHADDWAELGWLMPSNTPAPAFVISTKDVEAEMFQVPILVSKEGYRSFVSYTRVRCKGQDIDIAPEQVLGVAEHTNENTTILCRMRLSATCHYLQGIKAIPNIDWMNIKWDVLRHTVKSLGCN
jgi:hypothetical protein